MAFFLLVKISGFGRLGKSADRERRW